jgi:glyoxylase-like metal-dependent hydrolase (beta-lactamase superfamily II)
LYQIANCELHSFAFDPIDSRMYVLISDNEALVVDPCISAAALQLFRDRDVMNATVIPTHEHYDHISGVNWLREHLTCKLIASEPGAKSMVDPKLNASAHFEALFVLADEATRRRVSELNIQPYTCRADEVFSKYLWFSWHGHKVEIRETPGHSRGSVCIVIDDIYVFTGDSLIKGRPTITRLPGGSRKEFADTTLPFLRNLPRSSIAFPGHGEPGYIYEFCLIRDR